MIVHTIANVLESNPNSSLHPVFLPIPPVTSLSQQWLSIITIFLVFLSTRSWSSAQSYSLHFFKVMATPQHFFVSCSSSLHQHFFAGNRIPDRYLFPVCTDKSCSITFLLFRSAFWTFATCVSQVETGTSCHVCLLCRPALDCYAQLLIMRPQLSKKSFQHW